MPEDTFTELFNAVDPLANTSEEAVVLDNPFPTDETESPSDDLDLMDALSKHQQSAEELAKREAELFLPKGLYRWEGQPTVVATSMDQDSQEGDVYRALGLSGKGRCMIRVSGTLKSTTTDRKGRFEYSFSPDVRYLRDQQGNIKEPREMDMFSQTYYGKITPFFLQAKERKPTGIPDVVSFIKSGAYAIYVTQAQNGRNYFGNMQKI